ncbi:hypothetical protein M9194_13730 [Vibrio sp. S4M6]|uniref:nuclear transport factor 2 family protein n=1 Tax=Vibrio sinus TaxID=2946865 RepID=UPI00202A84B9|nr:hypothetical protein [Vibrio sinus]MCL9782490.1 hypothetical protein [Vibrio sinus]
MNTHTFHQKVIDLISNWKIKELCEEHFGEPFVWEVKGTSQLSKTYTAKNEYFEQALNRLGQHLQPGASISVIDSYSVDTTLILELEGNMTTLSGQPYHNQYCWIVKTENNKITSITAYLDTLLLEQIIGGKS